MNSPLPRVSVSRYSYTFAPSRAGIRLPSENATFFVGRCPPNRRWPLKLASIRPIHYHRRAIGPHISPGQIVSPRIEKSRGGFDLSVGARALHLRPVFISEIYGGGFSRRTRGARDPSAAGSPLNANAAGERPGRSPRLFGPAFTADAAHNPHCWACEIAGASLQCSFLGAGDGLVWSVVGDEEFRRVVKCQGTQVENRP